MAAIRKTTEKVKYSKGNKSIKVIRTTITEKIDKGVFKVKQSDNLIIEN